MLSTPKRPQQWGFFAAKISPIVVSELFFIYNPPMINTPEGKRPIPLYEKKGLPIPLYERRTRERKGYSSDRTWTHYNSNLESYNHFFEEVLEGKKIQDIVNQYKDPLVIDLMAPSGTLKDLFQNYVLPSKQRLGISLSLNDFRTDEELISDNNEQVYQLMGDISQSITWRTLDDWLDRKKANVVIQRPLGGSGYIANHAASHAVHLQRMWNLTATNGILISEYPIYYLTINGKGYNPKDWIKYAMDSGLQVKSSTVTANTILIHKTPDSPKNLPFPPLSSLT